MRVHKIRRCVWLLLCLALVVFWLFMNFTTPKTQHGRIDNSRRYKYELNEELVIMASDVRPNKYPTKESAIAYYKRTGNLKMAEYWENESESSKKLEEKHIKQSHNIYEEIPRLYNLTSALSAEISSLPSNSLYHRHARACDPWAYVYGDIYLFIKDTDKALFWSEQHVKIDPTSSTFWGLGEAQEASGSFLDAIKSYSMAYKIDPSYIYLIPRARVYSKFGMYQNAADDYLNALLDIDKRCDKAGGFMTKHKYSIIKSRILACPPYLKDDKTLSLNDVLDILDANKDGLPKKKYEVAVRILLAVIKEEEKGNLYDSLLEYPVISSPVPWVWPEASTVTCPASDRRTENGGRDTETGAIINADSNEKSSGKGETEK